MTVRPATLADAAAVARLEESFPASQRWSEAAWREEIEASQHLVLVGEDDGVVAACAWRAAFDVAELYRVVVAPQHRRRGLGSELVRRGLTWAGAQGMQRVMLEVAHDNDAAIALYRGHGFVPVAGRANYYGRGRDALIMERQAQGHTKEEPS
ncbi:MAG: GNAT family N-acetyltransferase [Propionibacteriaceae bacterium]|nr:GNAT family N-acetyltransferase [Propionibacteriaceae bacterium]